jgi:hypothetical protein
MTREQKAILASTPGRILKLEFLDAFKLSQSELSKRTGIPRSTINEIVKGKRPIETEQLEGQRGLHFTGGPHAGKFHGGES